MPPSAELLPACCYRLQLRCGTDFHAASRLLPYFQQLGISHLYLSPIFTARQGSTHGYDVVDPTRIDPVLGGRSGFDRLVENAHHHGLRIILDIVPNHMALSLENAWLCDVLRHGPASACFDYFDIRAGRRLVLPLLQAPFEECLRRDLFRVCQTVDGPVLAYGALRVPLDPASVPSGPLLHWGRNAIRSLHDRQFWRLCCWRVERDSIAHRRFFNITGLIGVRVEDARVFEATHKLIFDLVRAGAVDGLRVDHIDGLADPGGYLRRLQARLPQTPIWVEKILAEDEALPQWPVAGTTGYELARDISQLLTDDSGARALRRQYRDWTGQMPDFAACVRNAKREMLETGLSAELWWLQDLLIEAARQDDIASEYGRESWRQAIIALIACLDRYRSYLDEADAHSAGRAALAAATERAAQDFADRRPLDFLARCLRQPGQTELRRRFQQISGAVMAKGQEDTAFFRDSCLISANEVGGEPGRPAIATGEFHARMAARAHQAQSGLSLTSSHDCKRSEDARMRVVALTYHPEAARILMQKACAIPDPPDCAIPPAWRWYLVQSLWALHPGARDGAERVRRLQAHAVKSAREARLETTWRNPDPVFETAIQSFAHSLVRQLNDLPEATRPAACTAARLSLAQLVLKLTLPGIPDIYQGCELGSYQLTDPDNRRPVDFACRQAALYGHRCGLAALDHAKLALIQRLLRLRHSATDLFLHGSYDPIPAPAHVLGFCRLYGGQRLRVLLSPGEPLAPELQIARAAETRLWPQASEKRADVALLASAAALFLQD